MSTVQRQRFTGRVVIVTGASSGFGLATARALHREGARVVMAARNKERLAQAAAELQQQGEPEILSLTCDVSSRKDVDRLVAQAVARFGRIDILINNAGSGLIAPFESIQLADAIALFDTNFFGAFHCTQAVLPVMKRQSSGHIVNMASVAGLRGIPNSSLYCASKAALIAFSDALRLEVKPDNIFVTTICPGRTNDTPFVARAKKYGPVKLYKVPETFTTEMVVRALLSAIAGRKRTVIIPFHSWLLHTLNKFAPRVVDRILFKTMPRLETKSQGRNREESSRA